MLALKDYAPSKSVLEGIRRALEGLLRGKEVEEAIKEIQKALILADVDIRTVKELTEKVKSRIFEERRRQPGIDPKRLAYKIIVEELVEVLGGRARPFPLIPQKIMLVGLYGSGKTTTAAKLGRWFAKRGFSVLLVGLDVHRPAAGEQLKQLASQGGLRVVVGEENPLEIAERALQEEADVYIFDTAGRSSVDRELMEELLELKKIIIPDKTLLVVPADAGKVAGREAEAFKEVGIDGVIVTRLDGSGKAGGALAACHRAGVPVYFVGTGEKIDDIEPFDAERLVSRILGIPDMGKLAEKIKPEMPERFDINAFHRQLLSLSASGPLEEILSLVGIKLGVEELRGAKERIKKYDAIYKSMTKQERAHPEIINESRIRRIARGSGTRPEDVRAFLRDYWRAKKLFDKLRRKRPRNIRQLMGWLR